MKVVAEKKIQSGMLGTCIFSLNTEQSALKIQVVLYLLSRGYTVWSESICNLVTWLVTKHAMTDYTISNKFIPSTEQFLSDYYVTKILDDGDLEM